MLILTRDGGKTHLPFWQIQYQSLFASDDHERWSCNTEHVCTKEPILLINFMLLLQTCERRHALKTCYMTFIELVSFRLYSASPASLCSSILLCLTFSVFTILFFHLTYIAHIVTFTGNNLINLVTECLLPWQMYLLLALLLVTMQFNTLFPLDRCLDESVLVTFKNQLLIFFRSFKTHFYSLFLVLSYVYPHLLFRLHTMFSSTNIQVFTSFSLPLSFLPKKL